MKKQTLSFLLAGLMILSLTACGEKKPEQTTAAPAATAAPAEKEYVEEHPAKNELDQKSPIPGDTGTLTLTEKVFEQENLKLMLPEGVTAVEGEMSEQMGEVTVTDDAGEWKLMFRPFVLGYETLAGAAENGITYDGNPIKTDWSKDVSTTLAGFPARVWANNIRKGWLNPTNEQDLPVVHILIDYGETYVGRWYGLYIRLEAADPKDDTNIYEYLYRRHLRAVLNNFEVIKTLDLVEHAGNGITVSMPSRWDMKVSDSSMVAYVRASDLTGGLTFSLQRNPDVQHHQDSYEGEKFTKKYGDHEFKGVIVPREITISDTETQTVHSMYLFTEFDDKRCALVHANLKDYSAEDYKKYLDDPKFVSIMESLKLDPSAYHEPGTASADGFLSDGGILAGYTGGKTEVEIPAVIGGYGTVSIGEAFRGNADIKSVVIPEGVTEIGLRAFEGCSNLETVTFPDTLTVIWSSAFRDCPNLKDVVLPDSLTVVDDSAFANSGTGTFTGSGAVYGRRCFYGTGFEKISFQEGAELAGDAMFMDSQVKEVELPPDLKKLEEGAFANCQNVMEIELPDTVREIGPRAFTNMGGLTKLKLPEGIEELPESMTGSTYTDVIVIPESVKKIGDYAIFDANTVVIQSPFVEIGEEGINADYVYLEDASNFVFPSDRFIMSGHSLYLDGVYDTAQIQGDLKASTNFDVQVYVPMDATEEESNALDEYLLSIGYGEIAWMTGVAKNFIPESTLDFEMDGYSISGYHGTSKELRIPEFIQTTDGTFWYGTQLKGICEEAFAGKGLTSAFIKGSLPDGVGARILKDNPDLKDIWFNADYDLMDAEYRSQIFDPQTFAGVPEDVTVHLPACYTEEQRKQMEDFLHSVGMPAGASFEYYSLREEAAAKTEKNAKIAAEAAAAAGTAAGAGAGEAGATEAGASEAGASEAGASGAAEAGAGASGAAGELYVNDGTTVGLYKLYNFMGMTLEDFAALSETGVQEVSEMIMVDLKEGGKAQFISSDDDEPLDVDYTLDGDKIVISAEGETMEGTLKDGLMTLDIEGEQIVLARLTDAAYAPAN